MGKAASFNGNASNYLQVTGNSSLNRADTDPLYFCCWLKINAHANQGIVGDTDKSWFLGGRTDGKLDLQYWDGPANFGYLHTSIAVAPGVWLFVEILYNPSGTILSIVVNRGTPDTVTFTHGNLANPGLTSGLQVNYVNATGDGYPACNASIDSIYKSKVIPTTLQRDWLFNSTVGRQYAELGQGGTDGAALPGAGVWYDLDELTGNRAESTGHGNTLVEHGTVGTITGVGTPPPTVGRPVLVESVPDGITFTVAVSGGTGAKTNQFYSYQDVDGSPTAGTLVDTVVGTGTITVSDTSVNDNDVHHFALASTDSLGSQTVGAGLPASRWKTRLYVILLGDSHWSVGSVGEPDDLQTQTDSTTGAGARFARALRDMVGPRSFTANFQAVAGARVVDFINGGSYEPDLDDAIAAGVASGAEVWAQIQIGHNDGYVGATASDTLTALETLVAKFTAVDAKVVLHDTIYSSEPNLWPFTVDYLAGQHALVDGVTVFSGSRNTQPVSATQWPDGYSDGTTHLVDAVKTMVANGQARAAAQVIDPVTGGDGADGTYDNVTGSQQAIGANAESGANGGTGTGAYPINHNGGSGAAGADISIYLPYSNTSAVGSSTDVLLFDNGTVGVAGLNITAYVATDFDAGVRTPQGQTTTKSDGRWVADLNLSSGTYYLVVDGIGDGYQGYRAKVVIP